MSMDNQQPAPLPTESDETAPLTTPPIEDQRNNFLFSSSPKGLRRLSNRTRLALAVGFFMVGVILVIAVSVWLATGSDNKLSDDPFTRANQLLEKSPLVDGHNDLPWRYRQLVKNVITEIDLRQIQPQLETDIPRLRQGRVGGQFWSVYIDCGAQWKDAVRATMEQIDDVWRMVDLYPDVFEIALTADDIENAFSAGRIASLMGMEGGHSIDSSMAALRMMYKIGARYMTLTHNCDTPWAESCCDGSQRIFNGTGLNDFGRDVVREMNRMGMLVDISHVSVATMLDVLSVTEAPVIFSHSSAYALCPTARNVPDDILRLMPNNGGIVMVNFGNKFINCTNASAATLSQVVDHIDHIKAVAGYEHVGLGGDFDGVNGELPIGLTDVSKYPDLFAEMIRRGYSDDEVKAIAGLNIIRVLREAEKSSSTLRIDRQVGPSEVLIDYDFEERGDECRTPI